MTPVKIALGVCMLCLFVNIEVLSWTVDLNEVRKYVFNKNDVDKTEKKNKNFVHILKGDEDPPIDDYYENNVNKQYANDYSYKKSEDDMAYMEKKVHRIVVNGSLYLEGLQRSLETYSAMLENCTRLNVTLNQNVTNSTWSPPVDLPPNSLQNLTLLSNLSDSDSMLACRRASKASERVRRLSQLALKATKDLQDIAYAKKYDDKHEYSVEENELILKLAWFLDRLAHYTGYEPTARVTTTTERTPTSPPPAISFVNAPEEVKTRMMECLQQNSTEPATDRCRYPLPLPGLVLRMFNITDSTPSQPAPSSSIIRESVVPLASENTELLIATDARQFFYPYYNKDKIQSRSARLYSARPLPLYTKVDLSNYPPLSPVTVKTLRKRSIENPLTIFVNYYSKYKVWFNSNRNLEENVHTVPKTTDRDISEDSEVTNDSPTKSVHKRAIPENSINKIRNFVSNSFKYDLARSTSKNSGFAIKKEKSKRSLPKQVLRLPEDPKQDVSHYTKHKPGVNYNKNKQQAEKIREFMKKIRGKTFKRPKRSLKYEQKFLPRISEDPFQDLSYYVQNRPGTNINRNLIQAALVRAGLERTFQTGNIEVVRRYGANYNPLVPAPFYNGLILSASDI